MLVADANGMKTYEGRVQNSIGSLFVALSMFTWLVKIGYTSLLPALQPEVLKLRSKVPGTSVGDAFMFP